MDTYGYDGRVCYYVNSSPEETTDMIRAFAKENKLGEIVTSPGPMGMLRVRAGYGTWLRIRCLWTCAGDAQGQHIELQVLPSLLREVVQYLALCLEVVGSAVFCGVSIRLGMRGFGHVALICGAATAVLGAVIYRASHLLPGTTSRMHHVETEFARTLACCHPRIVYLQEPKSTRPAFRNGFILITLGLLLAGLIGALPTVGVLIIPLAAVWVFEWVAARPSMKSPWFNWRVFLFTWIGGRTMTCSAAFVCLWLYLLMGTVFTVGAQTEQSRPDDYIEAVGNPIRYYASLAMDRSVLRTNVGFLQGTLRHPGPHPEVAIPACLLCWAVLPCLTIAITIRVMALYVTWLKSWARVRQVPTATPGPPSGYPNVRQAEQAGLYGAVAMAAVVNVLHLVLTVDILSVLFAERYAICRFTGLSLGWALLDVEAAVDGIPEKSPMGIVVLLVLALPTLLILLGWISTALARMFNCSRRKRRIPVEPRLQEIIARLASQMAVCLPVVQVLDRDRPYLETMVSWLPGSTTLLVSRSALEELNERELEAAVAHELAHVKYDTRAVLATRWLSALAFFPCNVFALVLDTEKRERRADRAAVSVGASSDALLRTITKASLAGMLTTTQRTASPTHRTRTMNPLQRETFVQRFAHYGAFIRAMVQPEFMLGYTHPTLAERRSALQPDSSEKPNN